MSKSSIATVLTRIAVATEESPIAVFYTDDPAEFEAVFAAPITTKRLILASGDRYIGTYHRGSDIDALLDLAALATP